MLWRCNEQYPHGSIESLKDGFVCIFDKGKLALVSKALGDWDWMKRIEADMYIHAMLSYEVSNRPRPIMPDFIREIVDSNNTRQ